LRQLTVEVAGDRVQVSVCNCLACRRRTGSVFGMQARRRFFCPLCDASVYSWIGPERIAVGAFADPGFPAPRVPVGGMHPWVGLPDGIEHIA
jgi:hypothetical protein